MNYYWNEEKDDQLQSERSISFKEARDLIFGSGLLDDIQHPNQERYPGQRMFIIQSGNYAFLVPYIADETSIFLKTIIPSRKATRDYLR